MQRLKASEVASARQALYLQQGSKCKLCGQQIETAEQVLDHCHTTGEVRGVLHRGCNAMLGHLENNLPRHRLTDVRRLSGFLSNVIPYMALNIGQRTGLLYPTHKTDEEKRLLRNKRARLKRAKANL